MIIQNTENKPFNELSLEERKYIANLFAESRQVELEVFMVSWYSPNEQSNLIMDRPYRTKVQHAHLNIPWDTLEDRWKFAAMDENLDVYVYEDKPYVHVRSPEWVSAKSSRRISEPFKISNLPFAGLWTGTLTERPQKSGEQVTQASVLSEQEGAAIKEGIYREESQAMDLLREFNSFMNNVYDWPDTTSELEELRIIALKVRKLLRQ